MNTRVFLGNLPYNATESVLYNELAILGFIPTNIQVVMDRETGNCRGFGFAEFNTLTAAEDAIKNLNGQYVLGRPIRVDHATSKAKK